MGGIVLFTVADLNSHIAEFGWPCGNTFIPNRSKCWTDPKTGRRLKKPMNYQVYQKIQQSKSKAAQTLYKDREQNIRDRRRAAVPGWRKQVVEPPAASPKIPLPDKNQPFNLQEANDFSKALLNGEVTPEHIKTNWERFKNSREDIKAELSKMTKAELSKAFPNWRLNSSTTKSDLIEISLNSIEKNFIPGSLQFNPFEKGSREAAIEKAVASWDQETIDKKAEGYKKAVAERKAEIGKIAEAIKNPQTLEDFEIKQKYAKDKTLTPEQQKLYDELVSEKSLGDRKTQVEQKGKIEAIQHSGIKMSLRQTKHTKTGEDLHVASLDERVDRETYDKLNQRAKKLGGYYSSYTKGGAIPGFTFKDPGKAKEFISLEELDKGAEKLQDKEARGSERLTAAAESLKVDANERLSRDRLANTARRARMAASAEADASRDLFIADTMQNIADAIADGKAKYLSGINSKAQVEQLESILKRGHHDYALDKTKNVNQYQNYLRYETVIQEPVTEEAVTRAKFPYPQVRVGSIRDIAKQVKDKPGLKALSQKMTKKYEEANSKGEYGVKFQSEKDIEELRTFISKADRYIPKDWDMKEAKEELQNYDRIRRTGINSPEELRTALREYLGYRGAKKNADPIKKLERDLVGVKIDGYFPTPDKLAVDMADRLDVKPGHRVLEPSAGKGSLADAVLKKYGSDTKIDTIEVNSKLANLLKAKGYDPKQEDFLELKDAKYDRIIMNPPFERGQDIDHVRHAYDLLEPGGKMVAIMGEGGFFRSDKKSSDFREWLNSRGGSSEKLPEGSFKTSDNPTGVNTRLVVIEKPRKREKPDFSQHLNRAEFNNKDTYIRRINGRKVVVRKGWKKKKKNKLIKKIAVGAGVAGVGILALLAAKGRKPLPINKVVDDMPITVNRSIPEPTRYIPPKQTDTPVIKPKPEPPKPPKVEPEPVKVEAPKPPDPVPDVAPVKKRKRRTQNEIAQEKAAKPKKPKKQVLAENTETFTKGFAKTFIEGVE